MNNNRGRVSGRSIQIRVATMRRKAAHPSILKSRKDWKTEYETGPKSCRYGLSKRWEHSNEGEKRLK